MFSFIPILVLSLLAICFLAASWPLLAQRQLRPALAGITGTGCIAGGASLVALLVSGLIPSPGLTQFAAAQEEPKTQTEAATTPASAVETAPSSAVGSSAALPALAPSTSPSADPVIESPPETEVVIPAGRPQWVEAEPSLNGEVHYISVYSGPHKRQSDAESALQEQLNQATNDYITEIVGNPLAATFIGYNVWNKPGYNEQVKPENRYEETIVSPTVGPMHQIHALLEFSPSDRQEIEQSWNHVRATSRLTQLGLFAGAGLLLIGSVFGYFRLDNATRGYYTGRLQFMTAAAILAVVGGGALVAARWIHWL